MVELTQDNIIDLTTERTRRVHDLHEKRLQNVRAAFIRALPLAQPVAKAKKKNKKSANSPHMSLV